MWTYPINPATGLPEPLPHSSNDRAEGPPPAKVLADMQTHAETVRAAIERRDRSPEKLLALAEDIRRA